MSIEKFKEEARRHEQNEEWQKALTLYKKAIAELARDDQPDIGLYNRVGDLYVRVGDLDEAVDNYEQAVGLYREAFLPNNAIAVCKKIIRNVPGRHEAYLRMGQIRAEQGFLSDARTNFLTYAERMQQDGDLDESFRALIEFCDLAPDDVQVRLTVADQMAANGRNSDAVDQLVVVYRRLARTGEGDLAAGVERKILGLDPSIDLEAAVGEVVEEASKVGDDGEIVAQFGEIQIGGSPPSRGFPDDEREQEEEAEPVEMLDAELVEAAAEAPSSEPDDEEREADPLPMLDFGEGFQREVRISLEEDEEEEEPEPLPMFDTAEALAEDDEDAEEEALPMFDVGFEEEEEDPGPPLPLLGEEDEAVLDAAAFGEADHGARETQEYVTGGTEMPEVEVEVELGLPGLPGPVPSAIEEAFEEAAAQFMSFDEPEEARPAPEEAPAIPSAPKEEYVDLASMILGDDDGEVRSTRFTVAYQEPSGDEDADFAKMLSQFKEKVSANLDAGDVKAHHDLGTAYKEMGLLDEAITEFQAALRASPTHLATYELMGQTFIEMGKPEAAVKSLERALRTEAGVEDDLIGIYYYLAQAHEQLGQRESAVEFYDRVFSLDINFADVTERLRHLR